MKISPKTSFGDGQLTTACAVTDDSRAASPRSVLVDRAAEPRPPRSAFSETDPRGIKALSTPVCSAASTKSHVIRIARTGQPAQRLSAGDPPDYGLP
ncbi:hypothetical protein EVAR_76641_1 [Eumeta japonica]|uniref:Uncharacterized protein n=1 Tax=Eumeta variegata TaxID=151549 RepID=A0A4C1T593_EUMVA|nr:hypothetical protein EVAR_76641_1 [Eumeta japonica]